MFSDTGDIHTPSYTQDLSGTILHADQPVVTYGGHGCTFIPEHKKACDHLESSMFPVQSLGTDYIVTMPHTPHGEGEWVRIMAFYDNTKIVFDPPVSGTNGAVLNVGDVLDLPSVSQPFAVHANGRIFVAHYELGEFSTLPDDAGVPTPDLGDPSECPAITDLAVPFDVHLPGPQLLRRELDRRGGAGGGDGDASTGRRSPRATSSRSAASRSPSPTSSSPPGSQGHSASGSQPFGLYVYGYGSRTSYMYPGGLDLRVQVIPPPPAQ